MAMLSTLALTPKVLNQSVPAECRLQRRQGAAYCNLLSALAGQKQPVQNWSIFCLMLHFEIRQESRRATEKY